MTFFRILWAIDALTALVFLYFFFAGVADGSVSSFNILLWTAVLGGLAIILGGGLALRRKGHRKAANALLLVLAFPSALAGLFLLIVITTQPNWH